jgi:hypothetical protein
MIEDSPLYVWAFCMTTKRDDLSQWRGYANDASGICIGIDKKKLYEFCYTNNPDYQQPDVTFYGLHEINYNPKKIKLELTNLLNTPLTMLELRPDDVLLRLESLFIRFH